MSFAEEVYKALSEPENLPQEFKDWLPQHVAQNPVPLHTTRTPAIQSTGLTGSTADSRYVGATSSGAPASGYHKKGDFVIDQSADLWICTVAGSPGTWADVKSTGPSTLKWCIHTGDAKTLAGNGGSGSTATIFSGLGPGNSAFYTNDSNVFELNSTTIGGTTYYGIAVKTDGNYMVWPSFVTTNATATNPIDLEIDHQNVVLTPSWFEVGPFAQVISSLTHNDQVGVSKIGLLTASSLSYPTTPLIYKVTNFTNYAPTGQVNVFAWMMDTNNGSVT